MMGSDDLEGISHFMPINLHIILIDTSFSTFSDAFVDAFASITTTDEHLLNNNNNDPLPAGILPVKMLCNKYNFFFYLHFRFTNGYGSSWQLFYGYNSPYKSFLIIPNISPIITRWDSKIFHGEF